MIYGNEVKEKIEYDVVWEEYIEALNEAYVGKTDTLLEIEKTIGLIRRKITSRFKDINASKEVQTLNRLMEKQFGMSCFALNVLPTKELDAYTITLANNIDLVKLKNFRSYVTADRVYGFRFTPNNFFCVNVNISYGFFVSNLTDGELLAILLHECGHIFADFVDNKIRIGNIQIMEGYAAGLILYTITRPWKLFKNIKLYNSLINAKNMAKAKKKQKRANPIKAAMSAASSDIHDFFHDIKTVLTKLSKKKLKWAESMIDAYANNTKAKEATIKSLDRRNEVIADKFAAIYGYGPELATGLDKSRRIRTRAYNYIDGLPGGKEINDRWDEVNKDINEFDEHPYDIQRFRECIKTLEDELKQADMDPKMKDIIISQIKELEDIITKACDIKDKDEREIKIALYDAYVNETLPDAVTEEIENEINAEYNKIMESKKKK